MSLKFIIDFTAKHAIIIYSVYLVHFKYQKTFGEIDISAMISNHCTSIFHGWNVSFKKKKKKHINDLHLSWEKTMKKQCIMHIFSLSQTHWETIIMVKPLDTNIFVGSSQEWVIRTLTLHSTEKSSSLDITLLYFSVGFLSFQSLTCSTDLE